MIAGIGVDTVHVPRIARLLQQFPERFLQRVFTEHEQKVKRQPERLAARFAAKEAVLKALGTGKTQGIRWVDVEVWSQGGAPCIRLHGRARYVARQQKIGDIHISLTHEKEYATAFVVAVRQSDEV